MHVASPSLRSLYFKVPKTAMGKDIQYGSGFVASRTSLVDLHIELCSDVANEYMKELYRSVDRLEKLEILTWMSHRFRMDTMTLEFLHALQTRPVLQGLEFRVTHCMINELIILVPLIWKVIESKVTAASTLDMRFTKTNTTLLHREAPITFQLKWIETSPTPSKSLFIDVEFLEPELIPMFSGLSQSFITSLHSFTLKHTLSVKVIEHIVPAWMKSDTLRSLTLVNCYPQFHPFLSHLKSLRFLRIVYDTPFRYTFGPDDSFFPPSLPWLERLELHISTNQPTTVRLQSWVTSTLPRLTSLTQFYLYCEPCNPETAFTINGSSGFGRPRNPICMVEMESFVKTLPRSLQLLEIGWSHQFPCLSIPSNKRGFPTMHPSLTTLLNTTPWDTVLHHLSVYRQRERPILCDTCHTDYAVEHEYKNRTFPWRPKVITTFPTPMPACTHTHVFDYGKPSESYPRRKTRTTFLKAVTDQCPTLVLFRDVTYHAKVRITSSAFSRPEQIEMEELFTKRMKSMNL